MIQPINSLHEELDPEVKRQLEAGLALLESALFTAARNSPTQFRLTHQHTNCRINGYLMNAAHEAARVDAARKSELR